MKISTADDIIKQYEHAKSERYNWETQWQDAADYTLSSRQFTVKLQPGQTRNGRIFSPIATNAVNTLAAALDGLMTNTSIRWFALGLSHFDESEDEEVFAWLYHCTSLILEYFASSNSGYATSSHENYLDHCAFGTAITQVTESPKTGMLRFKARSLANFYVRDNDEGEFDEVYRCFEPMAKELPSLFPDNKHKFSEATQKLMADPVKCYERVPMLHCVYRRDEYDPRKRDRMNKSWGSVYVELKGKTIIEEGGHDDNPYIISRWSKAADEVYGRSPTMDNMPFIKVLHAKEKLMLMAEEKVVNPPLLVPANGLEGGMKTSPGGITYYKFGGGAPTPLYEGINLPSAREGIRDYERHIQNAFFLDALQLPEINRMTREEVITRRQQGLLKASPVLARMNQEKLEKDIALTFNWMMRTKRLPEPPPQVMNSGRRIVVDYVNPMALSRRISEAEAFTAAMTTAAPLAGIDPGVTANIDGDRSLREIFHMHNVSPKFLRSAREVAALRKSQQDAAALSEQIALAQGGAGAIRDGAAAVKDLAMASPQV